MVMLTNGLIGNGVRDWLVQRVSAVVIAVYFLTILYFFLTHSYVEYDDWALFMFSPWMRIFTLVVLLNVAAHAWLGMWRVTTDYITHLGIKIVVQSAIVLFLLGCLIWGVEIIWGI